MDVAADIAAPARVVWSILTDTTQWPTWGPSVRAVDAPSRFVHAGMRGRVRTAVGLWLPFSISELEDGRRWAWRVAGLPATGHRVEPLSGNACRAVFEIPRWAAPYALVCRVALGRIARIAQRGPGA
jgi:hypothetical protein